MGTLTTSPATASGPPSGCSMRFVTVAPVAPGGTWNSAVVSFPAHSYTRKIEPVRVLGLLHGGENNVVWRDRSKRVLCRQRARVRRRHHGLQRIVVLPSMTHRQRVLPRARVGIKRVVEVMLALVGVGIGPRGRAQQRDAQHVARCVVSILVLVKNAQPVDLSIGSSAAKDRPSASPEPQTVLFRRSCCASSAARFRRKESRRSRSRSSRRAGRRL